MSFNPQALSERTLKQFVDRLFALRKAQPHPTSSHWPPKRSAIQEEIAIMLGFTSWHHAIHAVRPSQNESATVPPSTHSSQLYSNEPVKWTKESLQDFLMWATEKQDVSDIVFQTHEKMIIEIAGRLSRVSSRSLTEEEMNAIVVYLYGSQAALALLNNNEDLDVAVVLPNRYRLLVNMVRISVDGKSGTAVTIRVVPSTPPKLSTIYPEMSDELYSSLFDRHSGINIISGPTKSGKSTLLASFLSEVLTEKDNKKVGTYEDPIEFDLSSIPRNPNNMLTQTDIKGNRSRFPQAIQNAIRRNLSDISLEIRDQSTLSECLTASQAGHKLWCSLNSTSIGNTLRRLINVFDPKEQKEQFVHIISNVNVIISQKLVPTVDGRRTAIRETLVLDQKAKDVLLDNGLENVAASTKSLLKSRQSSFLDDARLKYSQGVISKNTLSLFERLDQS